MRGRKKSPGVGPGAMKDDERRERSRRAAAKSAKRPRQGWGPGAMKDDEPREH
jgi:hypothetical protein